MVFDGSLFVELPALFGAFFSIRQVDGRPDFELALRVSSVRLDPAGSVSFWHVDENALRIRRAAARVSTLGEIAMMNLRATIGSLSVDTHARWVHQLAAFLVPQEPTSQGLIHIRVFLADRSAEENLEALIQDFLTGDALGEAILPVLNGALPASLLSVFGTQRDAFDRTENGVDIPLDVPYAPVSAEIRAGAFRVFTVPQVDHPDPPVIDPHPPSDLEPPSKFPSTEGTPDAFRALGPNAMSSLAARLVQDPSLSRASVIYALLRAAGASSKTIMSLPIASGSLTPPRVGDFTLPDHAVAPLEALMRRAKRKKIQSSAPLIGALVRGKRERVSLAHAHHRAALKGMNDDASASDALSIVPGSESSEGPFAGTFSCDPNLVSPLRRRRGSAGNPGWVELATDCVFPNRWLGWLRRNKKLLKQGQSESEASRPWRYVVDDLNRVAVDFSSRARPTTLAGVPTLAVQDLSLTGAASGRRFSAQLSAHIPLRPTYVNAGCLTDDATGQVIRELECLEAMMRGTFPDEVLWREVFFRSFLYLVPDTREVAPSVHLVSGDSEALPAEDAAALLLDWAHRIGPIPTLYDPWHPLRPGPTELRDSGADSIVRFKTGEGWLQVSRNHSLSVFLR